MDNRLTPFAKQLNDENPLPEYPRPQMIRGSYLNLNGCWDYGITKTESVPVEWDGTILVPFSPESMLSGVERTLHPNEFLWYRRGFALPQGFINKRVLLHFGAVDQCCVVSVNGKEAGRHDGGSLPFYFDITDLLYETKGQQRENELVVMAIDETETAPYARGRQKLKPDRGWHQAQSGIWQTVWLESVPENYIETVKITPLYDHSEVEFEVRMNSDLEECRIDVFAGNVKAASGMGKSGEPIRIALPGAISWHPNTPFLYSFRAVAGEDRVAGYFGMRKFDVKAGADGISRFYLNNKPFFVNGINDIGLYSDGLYTPASDEAMIADITFARRCGFKAIHKESKIEPLRWYYHCDKIGMLVWQDLPGGGQKPPFWANVLPGRKVDDTSYAAMGRQNKEGRATFIRDMQAAADLLKNCVCVTTWVLFNGGQGQFDAAKLAKMMKKLDPTRLVDHVGAGFDQGEGDINSLCFTAGKFPPAGFQRDTRAVCINQAGGLGLGVYTAIPGRRGGERKAGPLESLQQTYDSIIASHWDGLSGVFYSRLTGWWEGECELQSFNRRTKQAEPYKVKAANENLSKKMGGQ